MTSGVPAISNATRKKEREKDRANARKEERIERDLARAVVHVSYPKTITGEGALAKDVLHALVRPVAAMHIADPRRLGSSITRR